MLSLGKYTKAVTAFVLSFGAFLTADLSNPEIAAALPDGATKWLVGVAVPAVVGFGAYLARNQQTVDTVDTAIQKGDISLKDLEDVLSKWRAKK